MIIRPYNFGRFLDVEFALNSAIVGTGFIPVRAIEMQNKRTGIKPVPTEYFQTKRLKRPRLL